MKKNETKYIFISNGYKGGNTTFFMNHINYLKNKKKKIILLDDDPLSTYDYIPKNIKYLKIKTNKFSFSSNAKLKKILISTPGKKIIFIANYAFLIKFFFIFFNLKNNTKVILTIHSGLLNLNFKNYVAGLIFSLLYSKLDYLYFGSESAKMWWKLKFPWMNIDRCLVHYNGVKLNRFNKFRKLKKIINISFVGRLESENNPNFFLKIASKYIKTNDDTIFNIFGNGKLKNHLENKYSNKKIIFKGWRKKKSIFKKTDLVIITSPVNNFPYVALEAKSFGIPVITCSKGDISKIIKNKNDGIIKYTNSTEVMINLISKVLENYTYYSKNSLINAKKYDVEKLCNSFWKTVKS